MIPESYEDYSVRLYQAVNFPFDWALDTVLLSGFHFIDASIIFFNDYWWIFTSIEGHNDDMYLFYSKDLRGEWKLHPENPIVKGAPNIARPAGHLLVYEDRLYRFTQDDYPTYGKQVFAFEIEEITPESYKEILVSEEAIIKASGKGWNTYGMHHISLIQLDHNRWIAAVDGVR